jgi:predicted nucleotide-binding protein
VLLFYFAASDMIVHMAQLYQANQMIESGLDAEINSSAFAVIVATLFEIGFSLWLIFGSAGIVNLIKRFRGH